MRNGVANLGRMYAEAMVDRDSERMGAVLMRARAMGLDVSSVIRSAQTRYNNMQTESIQRLYDIQERLPYRQLGLTE